MERRRKPLIAAHRGASRIAPENTLEAFEKAIEVGAEMIEFDVRSTRDGALIAFHDADVAGRPLVDWSLDELPDALGSAPPLLEEVVALCRSRIELDVELKERGTEQEVLRLLEPLARDAFVVTSFLPDVVASVKHHDPSVRTGLLLGDGPLKTPLNAAFALRRMRAARADFVAPHHTVLARGLTERAVRAGVPLVVWTVNERGLLERLVNDERLAVIITDDPVLALELRA
jgi:glycerophosphoryl diester phosphodiesterase